MVRDQLKTWISMEVWSLPEWYSRLEIARLIGASKSPSLLKALQEKVDDGTLETFRGVDPNGRPVIKYRITEDYRERVFEGVKNG